MAFNDPSNYLKNQLAGHAKGLTGFTPPAQQANQFQRVASPEQINRFQQYTGGKYGEPAMSSQQPQFDTGNTLAQAGTGAFTGAAAGSALGPWGALGGALIGLAPAAVDTVKYLLGRAKEGSPEEQMAIMKQTADFIRSQQQPQNYQVNQTPTKSNTQQGLQGLTGLRAIADLFKAGQSFAPIEAQARRQFEEDYLPGVRAQGAGEGLSSHLLKNLNDERRKFNVDILAQKSKWNQEQNLARERNLPALLGSAQESNFENNVLPEGSRLEGPKTLENMLMESLGIGNQGAAQGQAQPAAPQQQYSPEEDRKYQHAVNKYNLGKSVANLPQEAQNQLRDITTRPERLRQPHTPKGSPALIKKLNTPEKINAMHRLMFSKNPTVAKLAFAVKDERDLLALQTAEMNNDAREFIRLSRKYKV